MNYFQPLVGQRQFGKKSATADTAYTVGVEPMAAPWFTLLQFAQFTVSTTAHTLTVLRPLSVQTNQAGIRCSCYLTAAAAASQAVININQDPGVFTAYFSVTPRTANNVIAANDYVMFQYPDGTWGVDTVASVSGLAVTLTNNLATGGLASGAPVFFFGITTDTNPYDARAHPQFNLLASTTLNLGSEDAPGFMSAFGAGEPLLVYVNNATAASTLERLTAIYSNRGSPFQANG